MACIVNNGVLNSDKNDACAVNCTSTAWRIIWSKRCAALNDYFHSLQLSYFLSTTMTECLQSSSMLRPNRLQWVAPTHQPQNHQNRAHTVQANPLRGTLWKDSLCFPSLELTFSLLGTSLSSLWVSAFIGKLCITSHALWFVGVWLYSVYDSVLEALN